MSTGELEAGRPRLPVAAVESTVAIPSPWRIAWRRFLRDRVAVASGIFLMPAWAAFVVRRLASSILLLLLLLTLITFVVFSRIPSNPAAFLIDLRYATPARLENAGHVLGADKPIFVQYGRFVWRALHGDLGRSYRQQRGGFTVPSSTGTPVAGQVLRAGAVTGAIAFGGAILLFLVSVPLGMPAGWRPRSTVDRAAAGVSMIGISTHPLVVALLLQLFLASKWRLLPETGYCDFFPKSVSATSYDPAAACSGPGGWAEHLAIPWIDFTLFFVALYSRMVRARMLEVLDEPYIRTARAKGASPRRVMFRHALPNTAPPIITMVAMDIGTAVGICVYIEAVFRMPGLGYTTIQSMEGSGLDLPKLVGITLLTGTVIIGLNLLVDLIAVVLDPIIRHSPRAGRRPLGLSGRTT